MCYVVYKQVQILCGGRSDIGHTFVRQYMYSRQKEHENQGIQVFVYRKLIPFSAHIFWHSPITSFILPQLCPCVAHIFKVHGTTLFMCILSLQGESNERKKKSIFICYCKYVLNLNINKKRKFHCNTLFSIFILYNTAKCKVYLP